MWPLDLSFLSYKVSLQRYWETKTTCPQGSVQGCPLVRDGNCVPGWILLLKTYSHYLTLSILILSTQAKFSSQDVCFQRQSLPTCFNYSGRNKCNQHIFSVSKFQECVKMLHKIFFTMKMAQMWWLPLANAHLFLIHIQGKLTTDITIFLIQQRIVNFCMSFI